MWRGSGEKSEKAEGPLVGLLTLQHVTHVTPFPRVLIYSVFGYRQYLVPNYHD